MSGQQELGHTQTTPTPWRVGRNSEGDLSIFSDDGTPDTPWTICEMCMMSDDDGTPNAELIVTAVNDRATLLSRVSQLESDCRRKDEALRAAEPYVATSMDDLNDCAGKALALLRDALSPAPQPDAERCPICSWPYAESREKGCVPGDCSYRPREGTAEYERVKRNRERVTQPDAAPEDDIVARLRLHQIEEGKSFFALWDEAANEIERLRATLASHGVK